jgi:hypothetical protein
VVYQALKELYPEATFPPVYFVVGRFNSGGTVSKKGLILGVEMMKDLEGLVPLVAHELIHFQQKQPLLGTTLLEQGVLEGGADFMGELISRATKTLSRLPTVNFTRSGFARSLGKSWTAGSTRTGSTAPPEKTTDPMTWAIGSAIR